MCLAVGSKVIDGRSSGVSSEWYLSRSLKLLDTVSIEIRARRLVYRSARQVCLTVRRPVYQSARQLDIVSSDKNRNGFVGVVVEMLKE